MTRGPSLKKRLLVYPIVAALFSVAALYIVYSALGYDISFKDGKISTVKTGLIILNSKPGDAKVFLDEKLYKKRTPSFSLFSLKLNKVEVGQHNVRIERDGFETWQGLFDVEPGLVSWGNYIILVPKERKAQSFNYSGEVVQTMGSQDKSRQMVLTKDAENKVVSLWEINTINKENKRVFEKYYQEGENYRLLEYSQPKERVLLEKTIGEVKSLLVIDSTKENGQNWDITKLFEIGWDKVTFNPRAQNEILVLKGGNLYNIDYQAKRMSAILESSVVGLYPEPTNLYFLQKSEENLGLWRMDSNGNKTNIIKALPVSESYQISYLHEFDGFAILNKKDKELSIYRTIQGKPTLKRIAENVEYFTPSPKSKYVGFLKENNFVTYDVEREKSFETLKNISPKWINWFYDEHNLIYGDDKGVHLVNYNGFYNVLLFQSENKVGGFSAPESLNIFYTQVDDKGLLDIFTFGLSS